MCPHTQTVAGKRFVCIRDDHAWQSSYVEDHRRAHQRKPINPDCHVMVREDRA
jgi:hypothetical protein